MILTPSKWYSTRTTGETFISSRWRWTRAQRYNFTTMQKRMEPVAVSAKNGTIWIEQSYDSGPDCAVMLHPSQVPTLVKWLEEAAREAELEERETALTGEASAG
jgi:hypothetical protein